MIGSTPAVLTWLVGLAAVWLLWRPPSSGFFKPQDFPLAGHSARPSSRIESSSRLPRRVVHGRGHEALGGTGTAGPGVLVTACSSAAGTSPPSPSPFASQADQVMADLAAGNFTAVQGKFDPAMIQANQAVPLPKAWAACQDALGTYRSHGTPTSARNRQFDLEQVPGTWANGLGMVTITFNLSGTIAGLHCYGAPPS